MAKKGHPKGEVGHTPGGRHVVARKGESPGKAVERVTKRERGQK